MTSWTRTGIEGEASSDPESFSRTSSPRKAVPLLGGRAQLRVSGRGSGIERFGAVWQETATSARPNRGDRPREATGPCREREIIGPIVGGGGGRFQGERSPARILHLPGAPGSADPRGAGRRPGTAQIGRRRRRGGRGHGQEPVAGTGRAPCCGRLRGGQRRTSLARSAISLIPEPSAKVGAWEANTYQRTPPRSSLNTSQRRIVASESRERGRGPRDAEETPEPEAVHRDHRDEAPRRAVGSSDLEGGEDRVVVLGEVAEVGAEGGRGEAPRPRTGPSRASPPDP